MPSAAWLTAARSRWDAWTPEQFPRLARAKHAGLVFTISVLAFVVFRVTAVPLIEPPPRVAADFGQNRLDPIKDAVQEQQKRLAVFFQQGDWELDNAKVLETSQGMLILKDYKNLGDGRVEIRPCTVLLLPEGHEQLDDEAKARRAVLMRAPEGAVLQFEEFNIRMARVGKLIGGDLTGPIVIHSQQRDPGPEDDLLIRTRDVQMAGNQIFTKAPVEFRLGHSYGSGRLMRIELLPDRAGGGGAHGPNVGGIRSFKLTHDVRMHLALDSMEKSSDASPSPIAPVTPKELEPPIEITSRGPFVFDVEGRIATFSDHVDVLRLVPNEPSDQLLCETLSVHFTPKEAAQPASVAQQSPGKLPKLEPAWIEAFGNPVVATAPSSKMEARGEFLAYDLRSRGGFLKALRQGEQVRVLQQKNEIQAREIHFSPSAKRGEMGSFLAIGPGWMRGAQPDQPDDPIEARWSKEARLRPHEGLQVLSVTGRAYVKSFAWGGLAADEIHAWMIPGVEQPDGKKSKPSPNRLLATGAVEFSSSQIDGHVERLEAYFERPVVSPVPPSPISATTPAIQPSVYLQVAQNAGDVGDAPRVVRTATSDVGQSPAPGLLSKQDPASTPAQRFDVRGVNLRLRILSDEPQMRLVELIIDQDVYVSEVQTAHPDEQPLRLKGDRVHLTQSAPQQSVVTITGRPAHIEARGLAMDSARIDLDQADNRMWTAGHGEMEVFVDRDLDGNLLAEPKPLQVTWNGGMEFDGFVARFTEAVKARQDSQELHAHVLAVTMQERVDFQRGMASKAPGQASAPSTKLARIECDGDVHLYQYTYHLGQLIAQRELWSRDLKLDQRTGDIVAHGPGTLRSVQYGAENPLLAAPGAPSPPPVETDGGKPSQLNFLGVDFQEVITGNLGTKELTFHDRVRTVYGPVPDWRSKLNPRKLDLNDERSFWLTTDALTVRQAATDVHGKPAVELETNGNTQIESQKFNAWASKLTYAQAKDLITLKGDGYTDALISRVDRLGDSPKETRAGTIHYSRANQSVTIGDFNYLDFSDVGGPKKK